MHTPWSKKKSSRDRLRGEWHHGVPEEYVQILVDETKEETRAHLLVHASTSESTYEAVNSRLERATHTCITSYGRVADPTWSRIIFLL